MKECRCKIHEGERLIPDDRFAKQSASADGLQAWCRTCKHRAWPKERRNARRRQVRAEAPEQTREARREWVRGSVLSKLEEVAGFLEGHTCTCGESSPMALVFREPAGPAGDPVRLAKENASWVRVRAALAGASVVCRNCAAKGGP